MLHTYAGTVLAVVDTENNRKLTFELPEEVWMKYILPKGYIAVNGCSLTIGEVQGRTFSGVCMSGRGIVWGGIEGRVAGRH